MNKRVNIPLYVVWIFVVLITASCGLRRKCVTSKSVGTTQINEATKTHSETSPGERRARNDNVQDVKAAQSTLIFPEQIDDTQGLARKIDKKESSVKRAPEADKVLAHEKEPVATRIIPL